MKTSNASVLISSLTCSLQPGSSWVSHHLLLKDKKLTSVPVNARAFETDLPANLNVLLYAYSICQKRWHLARKSPDASFEREKHLLTNSDNLEKVLRTAIAEHSLPLAAVSLPPQFYDMQYVALDIYEALRVWAETSEPTMNLQAVLIPLNAPVRNEESG